MNPLESRAWLALIGTSELLPSALDAQLQADSALTHFEFIVLSALTHASGKRMRLTDLAGATNATLPRLSKVVARLETRGLIERTTSAADRRAIDITLTRSGRRMLVLATPGHIALARQLVIDRLTGAQLEALADALEPVVAALDPQSRLNPPVRSGEGSPTARG